jgi:tetratricopeptide (TPR) repeat protein
MDDAAEDDRADDLVDRVDNALEAFWRGDSAALERLVEADGEGTPGLGELFGSVLDQQAVPIAGLPSQSEVGNYTITREIGCGGMGIVYEAEQQNPRRRVALKVLRSVYGDAKHVKLFRREIQTLARLQHPGVATIYEAGQTTEGHHFFTMELVSGVPLDTYVRDRGLGIRERLELFGRICEAVHYAHDHRVIHRDLKPSNILVNAEGEPRIVDFGLARITDADVTLATLTTESGRVVGTLAYMSPEQAGGAVAEVDHRSDVYALGVILYELLTGQMPFKLSRRSFDEAVRTIREQPPSRPTRVNRLLDGDLDTIVLTALEKDASRRYGSVKDLADDVCRYLAKEPIHARAPSGWYLLGKRARRHALKFIVPGLLVVVVGWMLWWSLLRAPPSLPPAYDVDAARMRCLELREALDSEVRDQFVVAAQSTRDSYPGLHEAPLLAGLAEAYQAPHAAIAKLQTAYARAPASWWRRAALAELYARTGQDAEAAEERQFVERTAPDTAEAWYLRSFVALDPQRAVRLAEKAIACDPAHALAWARLAYLRRRLGDYDGAIAAATHLKETEVESERPCWPLFQGDVAVTQGRLEEAIAFYGEAIELDPAHPAGYKARAHVFRRLRRYARAEAEYSQAIALASAKEGNPWLHFHRATVRWILGQPAEAIDDCRRVRQMLARPTFADARLYLMLRELGRTAEAEQEVRRTIRVLRERSSEPWLATVLECLTGELSPGELVAAAQRKNDAKSRCEACYYAGERCRLDHDDDAARRWFERCVATGVEFDADVAPDPMTEYELAAWRLRTMTTTTRPSPPP